MLPAALEVSPYVQVDDTGARHKGRNGYCTQIGNDLFASFESTDSKSRLNFLEILRRPHTNYVINEIAVGYWEEQKLAATLVEKLCQGPRQFGNATEWHARLQELGITSERHVRTGKDMHSSPGSVPHFSSNDSRCNRYRPLCAVRAELQHSP